MPAKVLIVDDEPAITTLVEYNLKKAGLATLVAHDGATALALARREQPDLVLLDVMLPDLDGLTVCRELRRQTPVPVIFLTARDGEVDKIVGLELGADDYITKPFSPGELVARVRAVLRRVSGRAAAAAVQGPAPLRAGGLKVDPARREVYKAGREVALTPLEFGLLLTLMQNRGLALSREQLLDQVWGADYFGDTRIVDVHIRHLREKIEDDPAAPRYIATVRGVGYKFREQP